MSPAHLSGYVEPAVLRDGGSVLIRAIQPADQPLLGELFQHLSPRSMQFRFLSAKRGLTSQELAALADLDFDTRAGLAAIHREDAEDRIIGVAHFFRSTPPGGTPRAEFAVAVADEHHGRGIGTVLLEHLARLARATGIEEFEALVLADNADMLKVFGESGFAVKQTDAEGVFHLVFPIRETERFLTVSLARERQAAAQSVRVFFAPAAVAVVGASRREGTIGRTILENLTRCGFRGPVYPVNPEAQEIAGLRCYASVSAIGAKVDLAVIAVPAAAVEQVVADCARSGVRGVVVISAGFAEASAEGRAMQDRLRRLVRGAGLRLVGPNCMGVLNADPSASLNATFATAWPPAGNVSVLSQSGALGLAILEHAAQLNIGIAGFVSVGNKADVSSNDLISYWADDPRTGVIALYLESFGNPRKFGRLAPEIARRKPIVAVKSGRSAAGTRAASSHSAALASLDVGVDALFAQAGVIRTNTLEELFDVVALLSTQPVAEGPRVGVVTNAGGPGILLADACEAHGLVLPELAQDTVARLRSQLPPQAGLANPVDMIASATPEQFASAIELIGRDPSIDALVVIYIPLLATQPEDVAAAIARAAGAVPAHKPIATVFMSSKGVPAILSAGPRGRIPSYSFPENAAGALAAAVRYGRWRRRPRGSYLTLDGERETSIRRRIEAIRETTSAASWLPVSDVAAILGQAGIAIAPFEEISPAPAPAAAAAERLGYPVVAKAVAPGLVHKSDVGGVLLGLDSRDAVERAARLLSQRLRDAGTELTGLIVQRQVDAGVEVLVGMTSDPSLGPILVVGLGGVQVELLRDVAFRLTPVSDLDAREMLAALRTSKLLDGYRGAPAADRDALVDTILKLSALVESVPELVELELNPVKVLPPGRGVVVVDARMRIAG
ncbi:MAG TPA: GNAT family N-acetyltransferase [Gemmatimonadales bacterium]|nr:GNAT family N-acetyltransferase [Gemmatimonadales bacterium]